MRRVLDRRIYAELTHLRDESYASGKLPSNATLRTHAERFTERFGPEALSRLNGEQLLYRMHQRGEKNAPSMVYWLEYKNDDEFLGNEWGGIGGGTALKFGLYQRGDAWISGSPKQMQAISLRAAIDLAEQQRNELINGCEVLNHFRSEPPSDEIYEKIQVDMEQAAPKLHRDGWAHKYWSLTCPGMLDNYHSPRYQRYQLYKMLQVPPTGEGVLVDSKASRFICGGRFRRLAEALKLPLTELYSLLNRRNGAYRRYWKVGTTHGSDGDSNWLEMLDGGVVSIGWKEQVPNLSDIIREEDVTIKQMLRRCLNEDGNRGGVATRKSGEIYNFVKQIAEGDIVMACEGLTVRGIGRITGPYEYNTHLNFPHLRRVEWLDLTTWELPENEGPRTTVFEIGKYPRNLIALEEKLALPNPSRPEFAPQKLRTQAAQSRPAPPAPLAGIPARIDAILQNKGQVILYGPPGTGKTMHAMAAAQELAARRNFESTYQHLNAEQRERVSALVQTCTFHPGWGYEDFMEGLRPAVSDSGSMIFSPRDGIFKQLCKEAVNNPASSYFLVIDEINRGDLPRIFGELITTIELGKRKQIVRLPVSGKAFSVPENVYLIGTMNTADRSVSLLDTALRRRFGFIELMPDSTVLAKREVGGLRLAAWLDALNDRLRRHLKRDARNMQIGHAYLLPAPASVAEFARIVRDDIIPLLEEYCYDDFHLLSAILGTGLVDVSAARIREELFDPNAEQEFILSVQFEEMQSRVLDQEPLQDEETDDDAP